MVKSVVAHQIRPSVQASGGDSVSSIPIELISVDIQLEQPSHGEVEVRHTSILCTDLDLCFCRAMAAADEPYDDTKSQYMAEHVPSLLYGCIPGFSAAGVITELGSGVLSHQIGQHVVYCNFPIKCDGSVDDVIAGSDSGRHGDEAYSIQNRSSTNADCIRSRDCCQNRLVSGCGATLAANDVRDGGMDEGFDAYVSNPNNVGSTFATNAHEEREHGNHVDHATSSLKNVEVDAIINNAHHEYKLCLSHVGGSVFSDDGAFSLEDVSRCSWMPLSEAPIGAQCEVRTVPAHRLIMIPNGVPDEVAVAALFPSLISLCLVKEGTLKIQELTRKQSLQHSSDIVIVLVYPAVHVLGSLLCQMASHLGASTVIAAIPQGSGSLEECDAHPIIFSNSTEFSRNVVSQFGDKVSIVYDLNGKGVIQSFLDCLKPGGLYVSLEKLIYMENHCSHINFEELEEGKMLMKIHYANYVKNEMELIENASEIMALLKANQLKCPWVKEYPLELATQAHKDVHSQAGVGGLGVCLLRPPQPDPRNIPDLS